MLEKLDLVQDGLPTRAAILLFAKKPSRFFPSALIRMGRFRTPTLVVDDREVTGSLQEQAEKAMAWFRERLQTRFTITGKPERDVVWEYRFQRTQ